VETHVLTEIPEWLLLKKTYAGGVRLPKWEPFKQPYVAHKPWEQNYKVFGPSKVGEVTSSDWLSNGDFRYWGSSPACCYSYGNIAYCRVCGETCWTKEGRKEHRKKGCGRLMETVCKMLRRTADKLCIICGNPTRKTVFGFYLCSSECVDSWKYYKLQPEALLKAIAEVKKSV